MCILVGGPATGKTALARTVAALARRPLLELTLTAGSDTSDLLGSFEQQEPGRQVQVLFNQVQTTSSCMSLNMCGYYCQAVSVG